MEVQLIVRGGKQAGQVVPVHVSKFFIGRSEECQLRPNSDLISRHHCVILVEEGLVTVRDFNSKNGTFINGQQIRGEQDLKPGDVLSVGPLDFEVRIEIGLGGQKKPKVHSIGEAAARTVEAAGTPTAMDDDEMDIGDWLGDEVTETRTMDSSPSGTIAMSTGSTVSEYKPEQVQPQETPKEKKKGPKSKPGQPHGLNPPKATDSQSAAADTLRQFLRRR